MLMFLKRQLSRLGDNLSESPNAAIKAEHGTQRLRLFTIVPGLLIVWQSWQPGGVASELSGDESPVVSDDETLFDFCNRPP
jgi:hypothetical protein